MRSFEFYYLLNFQSSILTSELIRIFYGLLQQYAKKIVLRNTLSIKRSSLALIWDLSGMYEYECNTTQCDLDLVVLF